MDTNVLVSGVINPAGPPGKLVDYVAAGALTLVLDDRILAEYSDVLRRPELQAYFRKSDVEAILDYIEHHSERVHCAHAITDLPDPDDAPFLEVAQTTEVPLITGNTKHFPASSRHGCRVVSPQQFPTMVS